MLCTMQDVSQSRNKDIRLNQTQTVPSPIIFETQVQTYTCTVRHGKEEYCIALQRPMVCRYLLSNQPMPMPFTSHLSKNSQCAVHIDTPPFTQISSACLNQKYSKQPTTCKPQTVSIGYRSHVRPGLCPCNIIIVNRRFQTLETQTGFQ